MISLEGKAKFSGQKQETKEQLSGLGIRGKEKGNLTFMDNAFIEEKEIMKYRFSNLIDLYRKVNMVIIIITMTIMGQEANK